MGNRYPAPAGEGFGPLIRELDELKRRVAELEQPTGTSMNSLLQQVQEAIANINATVTAAIAANSYTKTQIDSKIASPGNISPGTVTASGNVSGQRGTFPVGVNSTGVYNTLLTYGGPYSSQYVHQDGTMGYVPSSARYKQDIMSATLDPAVLRQLRVVTFRYIAAVENLGDEAAVEIGLIAEEVDALGLAWLVDYDSDGLPMGVRYDRLALALIPWMASVESRLAALEV